MTKAKGGNGMHHLTTPLGWGHMAVMPLHGQRVACCRCGWSTWASCAHSATLAGWHIEAFAAGLTCPACCRVTGLAPNAEVTDTARAHGYRGVSYRPDLVKHWTAHIWLDGHGRYLGAHMTEVEAARAYDREAIKAGLPLNFPEEVQQ